MWMIIDFPKSSRAARRGFTLIEMVTSFVILAVLCGALTSVMLMAGRATTASTSGAIVQSTTATAAVARIVSDLKVATSITEKTSTALTFTVPDRTSDGVPETIRYAWTGAGNPLTCQMNGAAAQTIAANVQNLSFAYLTRTVGRVSPPSGNGTVESSEQLLMSHDSTGGTMNDLSLSIAAWCADYVKPSLPANATSWKITRVKIMAKRNGPAAETLAIDTRLPTASLTPSASSIESIAIAESSLPSSYTSWTQATFSSTSGLDPKTGICLVVRQVSPGATAGKVNWEDGVTETDNRYTSTSTAGISWATPSTTQHLRFYLYGTVTTPAP